MVFLIALYLGLQLCVGYWVSKRVQSTTDFFLAGKSLPLSLVTISLVATWFGAETCIGSSGAAYEHGLAGLRADPFGYSVCLLLVGLFIAAPLWKGGYITIGDFFRARFGWSAEKLTVLILVSGSLFWGGAQIRAFGQIMSETAHLPMQTTILFCTVFVMIYTFQGGLLGDVINDFIQGIVIFAGLVVLLIYTLYFSDFSLSQWWATVPPERLSFIANNETPWERIDRWSIPILGSLITQELISRTLSSKSPSVARQASYWACGIYLVIGIIPVFLGLIGPQLLPNMPDAEKFLPALATAYLPAGLQVVFIGGIVAALLSTIDSILLSVSALTTQNLLHKYLDGASRRKQLLTARFLVIGAALTCYLIASQSKGIYHLVEMTSSFGTAGLVVTVLIGLWTRAGGPWAANFSLIAGAVVYHFGNYLEWEAPFLTAIFVSFLSFLAGWGVDIYRGRGALSQEREKAVS